MSKSLGFTKIIIFFLLLVSFSAISLNNSSNASYLSSDYTNRFEPIINFEEQVAIRIISDDNFTDYGFSGTGSSNDPFLITNYNITTTANRGILVKSTSKHFIISFCYIESEGYGIEFDSIASGTASIVNTTLNGNIWDGVYIKYSPSVSIFNSTVTNSDVNGIYLSNSPGAILENNKISDNSEIGINLWHSSNSTLTNNVLVNDGVKLYDVSIENYRNFSMVNNWINGKILGYFTDTNDLTFSDPIYGQLILIYCQKPAIYNQNLSNAATGVFLYFCDDAIIMNNTCNNNTDRGIHLEYSDYSTIENNHCNGNDVGIGVVQNFGSTLTNNTCNNSRLRGIHLHITDNCDAYNNTIHYSGLMSIYLWSSSGINVENNTCIESNMWGIYLQTSDTCIITYNKIEGCAQYGVYLNDLSQNNILHHNNFTDNNLGGSSQGYDNGLNNIFYDIITLEGNWWTDWTGTTTYPIDGSANNEDPYPQGVPMIPEFSSTTFKILLLSLFSITVVTIIGLKRKLRK